MTIRRLPRPALLLGALLALGACQAPGDLSLTYFGTGFTSPAARPVVTVGAVTDARTDGQAGTGQYGTIRGTYGRLLRLSAPTPVAQEVAGAFRAALSARGWLAGGPAGSTRELRVRIVQLDASKLVRSEVRVRLEGSLVDPATGAVVWTGDGAADVIESGPAGLLDPEALRRIVLRVLAWAMDGMLDRPDFAAALR